jgi:TolA-binding protein
MNQNKRPRLTDEALDQLARKAPTAIPPRGAELESLRTRLLLAAPSAAAVTPARARWPRVLLPLALAAGLATWLMIPPRQLTFPPAPLTHGTVFAVDNARYEHNTNNGDEVVQLHDGVIRVVVSPLVLGERFRVLVGASEVEVRGTDFTVAAYQEQLLSVQVSSGRVEVRPTHLTTTVLTAGQRFDAQPTAPTSVASFDVSQSKPSLSEGKPKKPNLAPEVKRPALLAASKATGETEFSEGWRALQAGSLFDAANLFREAAELARGTALAEDALFWQGAALDRASAPESRKVLERFLKEHPSSAHAGEASALLGWQLVKIGDVDGAALHFEAARSDLVPAVRKSAEAGLKAIQQDLPK